MTSRTPPSPSATSSGRMFLAIFGKHPMAADHLDDIGLETPALVDFKRRFYSEGLGACIERGVWSRELPGGAAPPYDHFLLTVGAEGWILARFAASEDAAGRAQYPLVVCRHGTELETLRGIDPLCAALDANLNAARQAGTVEQLLTLTSEGAPASGASAPDFASGKASWIGAAQPGLDRFVHAISAAGAGARCVRVPLGVSGPARDAVLWCSFLNHLQPVPAITVVWRSRAAFADLAPTPPQQTLFHPLFTAEQSAALVTEVPFQITPVTRERAAVALRAWLASPHLFCRRADNQTDPGFFEKLRRDFSGWWRS